MLTTAASLGLNLCDLERGLWLTYKRHDYAGMTWRATGDQIRRDLLAT